MKPNAKLTEAQRAVLDLANGTLTVLQISEHLGRNFRSVRNDIIALRSKGYDPQLADVSGQTINALLSGLPKDVRDELISSIPVGATAVDEIRSRLISFYQDLIQ